MQLAATPFAAQFNILEMISHIMRLQGEKNLDRFRLDLQDPAVIQQQLQAGNVVPIDQGAKSGGGKPKPTGSTGATV